MQHGVSLLQSKFTQSVKRNYFYQRTTVYSRTVRSETFHTRVKQRAAVVLNLNAVLCCARPGALPGGKRGCAGENRQQRRQRQDERLPESGPGGLAA